MKGKSIFTKAEAEQIEALIEQKLKADSSKQKGIRQKIRNLGFYAKDDFKITGGYTVADFRKVVTIVGQRAPEALKPATKIQQKPTEIKSELPEPSKSILNFENEILDELKSYGFKGFRTIAELIKNNYTDIPKVRGVYVLLYHKLIPEFVEVGTGGHFKARNPDVPIETLKDNWVDDSSIIYIGKAGAEDGSATLHSRLKQYFRFGQGEPVGHWGGRYVWQLKDCYNIIVCWKELPSGNPKHAEAALIAEFVKKYDKKPFANLVG
ncbi:hypothetical protein [Chryseobacterium sp. HSC-36S06]|uniref:hypothetical protein n=1 Tax=Chryseobacterium sp. HSC-36S06 TaxID=2910970 RepID=UPI0020A01113|nr:hypothetical protein [Chryseobacterium sp. HSC-36S06]MCP2038173.1 hypothetical protein [Chryseobacterium sp. HSC-36S06]